MGKSVFQRVMFTGMIAVCAAVFTTCEFDEGLKPLDTGVSGTITFFDPANMPVDANEVRLAALLKIPPASLGDVFFSNALEFKKDAETSVDSINYELALPPGDYPGIVLLWKRRNEPWSFNGLVGVYGVSLNTIDVYPVSIREGEGMVENADMLGVWLFANPKGKINGNITYLNSPPANTQVLMLVAFDKRPAPDSLQLNQTFIELFPNLSPINLASLPLPIPSTRSTYSLDISSLLNLFPIRVRFLGVLWKGFDTSFEDMKLIGFYADSTDATQPGTIVVPKDATISDINFNAEFKF